MHAVLVERVLNGGVEVAGDAGSDGGLVEADAGDQQRGPLGVVQGTGPISRFVRSVDRSSFDAI